MSIENMDRFTFRKQHPRIYMQILRLGIQHEIEKAKRRGKL